ncbi:MAG: NtaA/DmoA family FMN-dependent monooxygenase [Novosphingobium sp.]|nr:NtaA/DmoA family FMN-dependent monooxygenase [Novosphingobium sp.]
MARTGSKMHLLGHMCTGPTSHHLGSWRHPQSDAHLVLDAERYQNLARIYERGLFDGVFFVDFQRLNRFKEDSVGDWVHRGGGLHMLDPMQVLATMALVTRHLGLAATMSTTLNNHYHIARAFATLDHLSKGRAGWNIVTSYDKSEALNHGIGSFPDKNLRYDRADETVEACLALWNGWDEGAMTVDRQAGVFIDPSKIHYVKYEGEMVRTEGALTSPRPPQGHPVFMQAGASERGLRFAGRWAELVFTLQDDKEFMRPFYDKLKSQIVANGRDPASCKVLPAIEVVVGRTMKEAEERAAEVDQYAVPEIAIPGLSEMLSRDLRGVPMDTLLADVAVTDMGVAVPEGAFANTMNVRKDGRGLTIREAAISRVTSWGTPRIVGSPESIVDRMQDMFESKCCDGFIVTCPLSPGSLEHFVDLVVPELQRRGLYRTEYAGSTFRENLMQDD